jgi:hypothetical protein
MTWARRTQYIAHDAQRHKASAPGRFNPGVPEYHHYGPLSLMRTMDTRNAPPALAIYGTVQAAFGVSNGWEGCAIKTPNHDDEAVRTSARATSA